MQLGGAYFRQTLVWPVYLFVWWLNVEAKSLFKSVPQWTWGERCQKTQDWKYKLFNYLNCKFKLRNCLSITALSWSWSGSKAESLVNLPHVQNCLHYFTVEYFIAFRWFGCMRPYHSYLIKATSAKGYGRCNGAGSFGIKFS